MNIYQCVKCGKICLELHETTRHRTEYEGHAFREIQAIHLPLKAIWYDMIESGQKMEEYRLMSPYWLYRLCGIRGLGCCSDDCLACYKCVINGSYLPEHFDAVMFRYGYTKRFMIWSVESVSIGQGKTGWGAPENKDVFIFKLKDRLV